MSAHTITFEIEDGPVQKARCEDETSLLDAAIAAGIEIDAPCAGNGTCGKCRVRVMGGKVDSVGNRHIAAAEYDAGWRLACQSEVSADAHIFVPASAASFKHQIKTADLSTPKQLNLFNESIAKIFASGFSREGVQDGYGIAVDIGTTTVTAALIDLSDGSVRAKASAGNAQVRYGADVINRIIQQEKAGGVERLRHAILDETLIPLFEQLTFGARVSGDDVTRCVIAGNTTMQHLLIGANAQSIRFEPFVPEFLELHNKVASDIGLPIAPEAPVIFAPNVGSYVGGDISAGVLDTMLWNSQNMTLFVDLGTNGEIVFGNEDFMLTCACSAGPAFEGGDISCGMRACAGAIEHCTINEATMEPSLLVIDNVAPIGLCGSGIIDVVSELFRTKIVSAKGKFIRFGSRVREREAGGYEYIIAAADDARGGKEVTINEVDLDNFIRAKAAIYSGIYCLLRSVDMTPEQINRVIIAGGIGGGINMQSAISIGMLPKLPLERYSYVGNSSLAGACAMLLSNEAADKVFQIAHNMTYVDLSFEPGYMDEFIAACFLPHTNASLFE